MEQNAHAAFVSWRTTLPTWSLFLATKAYYLNEQSNVWLDGDSLAPLNIIHGVDERHLNYSSALNEGEYFQLAVCLKMFLM